MNNKPSDEEIKAIVSTKVHDLLQNSGLLEFACQTPKCRTQLFSTWAVDLTCNRCGRKVLSIYQLEKSWLQ